MTLEEKLKELETNHPEVYEVLCNNVPNLVSRPSFPTENDLDEYNFWIDSLDEDEAQHLYHIIDN